MAEDPDAAQGSECVAMKLTFDPAQVTAQLSEALQQSFTKVTVMDASATAGTAGSDNEQLTTVAREHGADVVLRASLSYDPSLRTNTNDKFWLNLPLFAIGGPFCWFVSDRRYFVNARLDAELYDVSHLVGARHSAVDASNAILRVDNNVVREADLAFTARADGVGDYLLSVVWPASLLTSESDKAATNIGTRVSGELCSGLMRLTRELDATRSPFVDFRPRRVHIVRTTSELRLEGEVELQLGKVSELGSLQFRTDTDVWQEAAWGEPRVESLGFERKVRVYPFTISLAPGATVVQIAVEQRDTNLTQRTFTYDCSLLTQSGEG